LATSTNRASQAETMTAYEVLTTTRAVRKRLDLTREVPRELLRDCVRIALQAPSPSNNLTMQFVIVTDSEQRRRLAEVYKAGYELYQKMDGAYIGSIVKGEPALDAQQQRSARSADYLADHLAQVPAIVVACMKGRTDDWPGWLRISSLGAIMPATWSFMLAARMHGLGTCWTSVHLQKEREAAEVLGIPHGEVTQVVLFPVAYYTGETLKETLRPDPEEVIHWDRW
jgi:nitroreductase